MAERLKDYTVTKGQDLLQIKSDNRVDRIHQHFLNGEELSPGRIAKILHLLPEHQKTDLRTQINSAQADFWSQWAQYRCSPRREGKPNFEDMIALMPAREEFRNFVNAQEDDLVIDLMGGSGTMAPYFENVGLAGYIVVDRNPSVENTARKQLSMLNFPLTDVVISDLSHGLPERLSEHISTRRPKTVRYISNWGLTYLDRELFQRVAQETLDSSFNHGVPATLDLNMITNGKFDRVELRRRFRREVIPEELKHLRLKNLFRAFPALRTATVFADNWPLVMPIWYPDEIRDSIEGAGLKVEKMDEGLLWGQSTAIRVTAS